MSSKKTRKKPSNLSKSLQHCLEVWSRTARNYEEFPPSEELGSAHLESGKPRRQAMFFAHLGMGMDTCRYQKETLLQSIAAFFGGKNIQRSYIYLYLSIYRSIDLSIFIYIYLSIDRSIYLSIYIYNYIYISIWVFSTRDSMGTHGPILRPAGDEAAPAPQAGWQDNGNVTAMGSENAAGMDRCPGLLLLLLILLAVRQMQPATN